MKFCGAHDRTTVPSYGGRFVAGGLSPGIMDCGSQALAAGIGDFTETERMPSIAI